jgi:hypothetical protein
MDFKTVDTKPKSEEGVWAPIYDPSETVKIAEFLIIGRDSKKMKQRGQELAKKYDSQRKISIIEKNEDSYLTLALATKNWRDVDESGKPGKEGFIVEDGNKIEFSIENVKDFYTRYEFVADQVTRFMVERTNFLER